MKTNIILLSKCILVTLLLTITFKSTFASNHLPINSPVINLKANVENNQLVINWNITEDSSINYCEVQGSEDGKTFKTIGYVMGADPKKSNNSFTFKQDLKKIKPGKIYYRVLNIAADNMATASEVVKLVQ